jgi:hypothetical protein
MPENPAGLGFPREKLVHYKKMPEVPYELYYYALRNKPGWYPSGIWHIECQTEVCVNVDTEMCACGVSDLDLARKREVKKILAITKLF